MLNNAIDRLKQRLATHTIRKSDDTASAENDAPDVEALASEVTTLLDAGTVTAETDKVKDWAVAKGLPDAEAASFADEVISAYFATDDDDAGPVTKSELGSDSKTSKKDKADTKGDGKEDEEEDEAESSTKPDKKQTAKKATNEEIEKAQLAFISQVQTTLEVLKSNQEAIASALEILLDRAVANGDVAQEVQKLKSALSGLASGPATTKSPVTSTVQKSEDIAVTNGVVPAKDRDKLAKLILKGIEAGKCQVEDISYFEAYAKLSPRAIEYVEEMKEVRK